MGKDTASTEDPFLQAQWGMPVIPVFRRLEQEDAEYETSLDQMVRPYLKWGK